MTPIRFERTIAHSEAAPNGYYLNLTDDSGVTYGTRFPPDGKRLWIITPTGKKYKASKKGSNQIWGGLRYWFKGENIFAGTVVEISFDQSAQPIDDRIPVSISVINQGLRPVAEEEVSPPLEAEEELAAEPDITQVSVKFERDLEDFIVSNLNIIEPGLVLYTDENGQTGRQYQTDVGNVDLLCKNGNDFVLIELKKGRTGDQVVGQISRYIGWVKEFLAEEHQQLRGIIIVHDYDPRLMYAVRAHNNLQLKYYEIQLKFIPEEDAIRKSEDH